MISKILPLTKIRLDILSELYIQPLQGKDIAKNIKKKPQVTHNTIANMKEILNKEKGLYSIHSNYSHILEKILVKHFLERVLGKYFSSLQYLKKYCNIDKMILFGSYFRREIDENSDIDIYIITRTHFKKIKEIEKTLTKATNVKFQIINVHPDIHLTQKDTFSELYNSISKDRNKGIEIPLDIL